MCVPSVGDSQRQETSHGMCALTDRDMKITYSLKEDGGNKNYYQLRNLKSNSIQICILSTVKEIHVTKEDFKQQNFKIDYQRGKGTTS